MKILITSDTTFRVIDRDAPMVGSKYHLEEANNATQEQNRAFHALVQEYWSSGAGSYSAKDFKTFRDQIKQRLGAGYEKIVYAVIENGKAIIHQVKRRDEVPSEVLADPDLKRMVLGKLKSWGDYSKKERSETIDRLIVEMHQSGVNTKGFHRILEGMAENRKEGER